MSVTETEEAHGGTCEPGLVVTDRPSCYSMGKCEKVYIWMTSSHDVEVIEPVSRPMLSSAICIATYLHSTLHVTPGIRCQPLLPEQLHQVGHLYGCDRTLKPFVAHFAPCSVQRLHREEKDSANLVRLMARVEPCLQGHEGQSGHLFHGLRCQYAKHDWDPRSPDQHSACRMWLSSPLPHSASSLL